MKQTIETLIRAKGTNGDRPTVVKMSMRTDMAIDPALPAARHTPNPRFLTLVGYTSIVQFMIILPMRLIENLMIYITRNITIAIERQMYFWQQSSPLGKHSAGMLKKLTKMQMIPMRTVKPKKALILFTLSFMGTDMRAATTQLTLSRIRFLLFSSPRRGTIQIDPQQMNYLQNQTRANGIVIVLRVLRKNKSKWVYFLCQMMMSLVSSPSSWLLNSGLPFSFAITFRTSLALEKSLMTSQHSIGETCQLFLMKQNITAFGSSWIKTIVNHPENLNIDTIARVKGANPVIVNITMKDQALNFSPPISLRQMNEHTQSPLPKNPASEKVMASRISHFSFTLRQAITEVISRYFTVGLIQKYIGQTSCPAALKIQNSVD